MRLLSTYVSYLNSQEYRLCSILTCSEYGWELHTEPYLFNAYFNMRCNYYSIADKTVDQDGNRGEYYAMWYDSLTLATDTISKIIVSAKHIIFKKDEISILLYQNETVA